MVNLIEMLNDIGIPYAFREFPMQSDDYTPPDPPFICYLLGKSNNISADNKIWMKNKNVSIELYTDSKDLDCEKKVTDVLDDNEIVYETEETKLDDDRLYEVIFSFEKEI